MSSDKMTRRERLIAALELHENGPRREREFAAECKKELRALWAIKDEYLQLLCEMGEPGMARPALDAYEADND